MAMVMNIRRMAVGAEAGVPLMWLFPVMQQKKVLLYMFGTSVLMAGGLPGWFP